MKMKTRFLLGVLLLFSITMQGQQVKVNYENITNSLPIILQEYFRMQGVQHLNLTIKGEFNGKRAKLKKISCNNGVFTERELLPDFVHFILVDSVETLDFMVAPYKEDSIRLTCFYPPYKPQNKMFHFCKTFCSKITLVNTIQNVILNPI